MADDTLPDAGPCRGGRMRRAFLTAAVTLIVLLVFWLIADKETVAEEAAYAQSWFVQKAKCWYWFDEGYSNLSFIREPV